MASTSAPSSTESSSVTPTFSRPQAGPLPPKRGEIGYQEDIHGSAHENRRASPTPSPLPARHPADRDPLPLPLPQPPPATHTPSSPARTARAAAPVVTPTPSSSTDDLSSINSLAKQKRLKILRCLKPKKIPSYGGIRLTSFLIFVAQLAALGGTAAAWAITTRNVRANHDAGNDANEPMGASSTIFIHVVFGIAALAQLLFLERRIFRLRAERYAFVHPGEMLPTARSRGMPPPDATFALTPWNRPPLPTYAAALAQSGVGTGDVEDHLIAVQPPPAYGNTRGSTLILAGFLRNSLRAQRPDSGSARSQNERPLSYVSRDDQWEEIQDAERARRLEETLSRLERPTSRLSQQR